MTQTQEKIQSRSLQRTDGEFSNSAATFTFAAMQYEEMHLTGLCYLSCSARIGRTTWNVESKP